MPNPGRCHMFWQSTWKGPTKPRVLPPQCNTVGHSRWQVTTAQAVAMHHAHFDCDFDGSTSGVEAWSPVPKPGNAELLAAGMGSCHRRRPMVWSISVKRSSGTTCRHARPEPAILTPSLVVPYWGDSSIFFNGMAFGLRGHPETPN